MAFANVVVEVGLNGSAFERGVSKVIAKAAEMNAAFGKGITTFASNQISQAFAVAAVINKMQAGISEAIAFGSSITDLSTKLDVSTDALQLWNFAATQNGATLGSVNEMFTKIAINRQLAVNGDLEMIAAFKKLGVTIDDVKNKKPEEIALQIGKAFENGVDPNTLVGSLKRVGGRGADALIAAFEKGIGATFAEGLSLNIVINPDELAKIDALGDRLDVIQMQMRPVFHGLAIVMLNVAEAIYDSVRFLIAGIMDSMSNFSDPAGFKNIKNPEIREKVRERGKIESQKIPVGQFRTIDSDPQAILEVMRSEKMNEINQLITQKKSTMNSLVTAAEKIDEINQLIEKKNSTIDSSVTAAEIIEKKNSAIDSLVTMGEINGAPFTDKEIADLKEKFAKDSGGLQKELSNIIVETKAFAEKEFAENIGRLQKELADLTNAYVEPFSAAGTLVQEKIDQAKAALKSLEVAGAKRATKTTTKPLVDESVPKKLRPVKDLELLPKITDSLSKVGGFTMGRDVISLEVAKQQLTELEKLNENVKNLDQNDQGDGL